MKFTGTFVGIKLDLSTYRQQLEDHLVQLLYRGARAWLQVVAGREGRVPLWSGMARGSLLELSELIDGTIILSPLRAKSRVSQGRTLGTAISEIDSEKVQLTIRTNVPHYSLQEYSRAARGGSPSAPWQSLQAGRIAFQFVTMNAKLPGLIFKPVKIKAI